MMDTRNNNHSRCFLPVRPDIYKQEPAASIQNHENENVRYIGQCEAPHRKYKRLNLAADMCTTVQVSKTAVVPNK
jgi:hypothetical protein